MRVLVTGSGGSIGEVVCAGLARAGHDVVGVDLRPEPAGFTGAWHTADCGDAEAVAAVLAEAGAPAPVEAVVHLAGEPQEASLPVELDSHVRTTAVLTEAMLAHGIDRLVYASSNHAVGQTTRRDLLRIDVRPRPDTFYGVAKVAAEALLSLYADRHGLDVVCARIGSFGAEPTSVRQLSTWLSHDDAVRMVLACLVAPAPGFAVLYGVSANTRGWWDLEPGRALGYHPQDDAEVFAEALLASGDPHADGAEAAFVGGPMATEAFHRPAFEAPPREEPA